MRRLGRRLVGRRLRSYGGRFKCWKGREGSKLIGWYRRSHGVREDDRKKGNDER